MKILPDFTKLRWYKRNKEKGAAESPLFTPEQLLNALGVEIQERQDDDTFFVAFQGGNFLFRFSNLYLSVIYYGFLNCTYDETVDAVLASNSHNRDYMGWNCYVKNLENGEHNKPVQMDMSHFFYLVGSLEDQVRYIRQALVFAFKRSREIVESFEKITQETKPLDHLFNDRDFVNKLEVVQRLLELNIHQQEQPQLSENPELTVENLIQLFDDTDFGCLNQLKIITDDRIEKKTDVAEIMQLDVRELIREDAALRALSDFTFQLYFEKQTLLVHFKKLAGSTEKSLFYALCVMRTGVGIDLYTQDYSSLHFKTTIEIRLTSEQEDYWEVKFMVDDAKEKMASGDTAELSEEQKLLLMHREPGLQSDAYWGKRFFTKGCYLQSLFYFRRIYLSLRTRTETDEKVMKAFAETSLYIGFIYSLLHMNDRAFYYLNKARRSNTIRSTEAFIDCLCSMQDSDVLTYIRSMMDTVRDDLEGEEENEVLLGFYSFLSQRYAHALIDALKFDEAEHFLHKMIHRGQDVDFARKELLYLEDMRRYIQGTSPNDGGDSETA